MEMSSSFVSPNDIEVLIHCHCNPTVHPRIDAPAVIEALSKFLKLEMVEVANEGAKLEHIYYHTTEKGAKYMEMLCCTPFPIREWIDPRENT
jgi:hypothetical protein